MTRRYSLTVRSKRSTWSFTIDADPAHVADWRADGLVVDELLNSMPAWLPWWLVRAWCWAEDILNFRNPWGRG